MFYRKLMLIFILLVIAAQTLADKPCLLSRNPFQFLTTSPKASPALLDYSVESLTVVGLVVLRQKQYALLLTPAKQLVMVTVGDVIGREKARVLRIVKQRLQLQVKVNGQYQKMVL